MNPENEIDKTEALEPVETAAANVAEARGGVAGRKRPKWLLPLIAVVCAVVLVVAGVVGWNMYRGAKLAEAKEACATAADGVRSQANEYNALLNGDAADAAAVKAEQVKDSKTVESLGKELKSSAPEYEGCVAENAQGLDAATVKLNEQADWYKTHEQSLSKAVRARHRIQGREDPGDRENESDGEAGRGVEAARGFERQGRGQRHPRRIVERHRRGERAEGRERSGEDRRGAQNAGGCHQRRERERPGKDGRGCASRRSGSSGSPGSGAGPIHLQRRLLLLRRRVQAHGRLHFRLQHIPWHHIGRHRLRLHVRLRPGRRLRPEAEPQRLLRLRQQLHRQG